MGKFNDVDLFRNEVKEEFKRFGFEEKRDNVKYDGKIMWVHNGDRFQSYIILSRKSNALYLEQYELTEGGSWKQTPFGVMAPLWEVISKARDAYQISLLTRDMNDEWSSEYTNIIPGTNG